MLTSGSSSKQ